jgi:phosphatidate phosphatase APP1
MTVSLPPAAYRAAHAIESRRRRLGRRIRRGLGLRRPLEILPYRGYGTMERALIKARVLEDNRAPPPDTRRPLLTSALVSYKRFATEEIPGARVRVRWDGQEHHTRTDEEGFVNLWVRPPPGTAPGWHRVQLTLDEPGESASATAEVLLVGDRAELGVISDLDDTVIVTGVRNLIRRAWALFMSETADRLPFEGVRGFYEALRAGASGDADNPIFYVSSSPWNLYPHLQHFLELHGIPPGPIVLRDWGLTRHGFAPGGGHGHKQDKLREIMDAFPDLTFVLIGDSGQQDPEHYAAIAQERPHQVRGIHIRDVTATRAREQVLRRLAERVRAAGSDMVLVADTAEAAEDAARRGWIRPGAGPLSG